MSKIFDIDYAASSPFAYHRITLLGTVMTAMALILFGYLFQQYQQASNTLTALEIQRMSIQSKPAAVVEKKTQELATPDETKSALEIVEQLSTPWNQLFSSLEESKLQNVALLSIEPNRKQQQLILTGQAKDMESTLVYLRKLEQTDTLSQVHLLQHSIDQNDPFKPLTFTIVGRWGS